MTKELTVTSDEVKVLRNTIAAGATDSELKLYMHDCQRQGVHPLDRMVHFTKRGGKYTPVTSIDFLRARAEATGEYAGNDDPVFDNEDNPQKASVTVYKIVKGQRCPFTATARWKQYFPGDAQGFMWRKMPHLMLGKCAEALALRKAFPKILHGLYAREEMDQAGPEDRRSTSVTPIPVPKIEKAPEPEVVPEPVVNEAFADDPSISADTFEQLTQKATEVFKPKKVERKPFKTNKTIEIREGDEELEVKLPYRKIDPIRESLKKMGFRWNKESISWAKSPYTKEELAEVKKLAGVS